jgi:ankyrin repeat protein
MNIWDAVQKADIKGIEDCLARGVGIDTQDETGKTALHYAASFCFQPYCPDAWTGRNYWSTVYHFYPKATRYLVEKGADVNIKDNDGSTPLDLIVGKHPQGTGLTEMQSEIAEPLILNGAVVNTRYANGDTLLNKAIEHDNEAVATLLIQKGAAVNAKNKDGKSPLHWAAIKDFMRAVSIMVKAGAKINARDNKKKTPLHYAYKPGSSFTEKAEANAAVIKILVENGAHENAKDEDGRVPEYYAYPRLKKL